MSSPRRRKNTSVIQKLIDNPDEFSFLQAVRLLERFAMLSNPETTKYAKNPVARFYPPSTEIVRFHTRQSLSFPSSEINAISINEKNSESHQWHMLVNFMGLTGSSGILPYHYSEMLLRQLKIKDSTMADFYDLFNHRTISLFCQSSFKYRLPLEYERKRLSLIPGNDTDSHTQLLLSLIGLGTKNLTKRLYSNDESLLFYAGLFTQKVRCATGLRQIIHHHFSIPVEIREFIGQWQELINDVRTRLPGFENPHGQNNCLGKSVMLGRKGWFAQGKFRIILGPLNQQQLRTFAPGTSALKALDEIVRFYINFEYDYDFVMRIRKIDIPARIKLGGKPRPTIGWNTWLLSKVGSKESGAATVDIPVSKRRLI